MRDPYLYENSSVLKNKLGIKTHEELENAEADYVVFRLKDLALNPMKGKYDTVHLLNMHYYLFQDLYEWAGETRVINIYKEEAVLGGMSIEYSDVFDIQQDIHFALDDMRNKTWGKMSLEKLAQEFSSSMAMLWKIHPFREGNTRTTVTFCCQFADEMGICVNRELFENNSSYLRTALVAYNAYFNDGSDFSKKEYLEKIVYDAIVSAR